MSECCNGHEHDKKNDDKNNKLDMILTIIGIVIFAFSILIFITFLSFGLFS